MIAKKKKKSDFMDTTYWASKGKHQKDYNRLWEKLVPESGEAETNHGEILRLVCRFYYDVYNNGLCNIDVMSDYMGSLSGRGYLLEPHLKDKKDWWTFIDGLRKYGEKTNEWEEHSSEYDEDDYTAYPDVFKHPWGEPFLKAMESVTDAAVKHAKEKDAKICSECGNPKKQKKKEKK
jgi:hypothetical protein